LRGRTPAPEPVARAAVVSLALWAPTTVMGALLWLLFPDPEKNPLSEPILRFFLTELRRAVPAITAFSVVASLLAAALWAGVSWVRRPLQAALIVGAVIPLWAAFWIGSRLPLPEGLEAAALWRVLFSTPTLVGALISGVPAVLAVWLLQSPDARRWAREP
jgi:hypothetical protein